MKGDSNSAITPIGREFILVKVGQPEDFQSWNSQTRLRHMILELRHRDKARMPWLQHIVKVKPQDLSCVAWYMHMDALC
jgi:hypothetical protein